MPAITAVTFIGPGRTAESNRRGPSLVFMWRPPQRIRWRSQPGAKLTAAELADCAFLKPLEHPRLRLRNRSWVPAMVPWRATEDGEVTEANIKWYEMFARGGCAAIVVEATGIRDVPSGPLLRIGHDRYVAGMKRLVDAVRAASSDQCKIFLQLIDFLQIRRRPSTERFVEHYLAITPELRSNLYSRRPGPADDQAVRQRLASLAPEELLSVLPARDRESLQFGYRERVTDLHLPHIAELPTVLPTLFAEAAIRAQQAGFDGVELHYAHAYTMASFLSATNDRSDGYGGSRENRIRLPLEVLQSVRSAVADDFTVGLRMLAEECISGGSSRQDACWFAEHLARNHADFISLSRGGKFDDARAPRVGAAIYPYTGPSGYECMPQYLSDESGPFGRNFSASAAIRKHLRDHRLDTPIIVAGGIHNVSMANRVLDEEIADVVATARQSLADPDWVNKLVAGAQDQIRLCEYTNYCEGLDQKHKQVTCQLWDRLPPQTGEDPSGIRKTVDGKRRLTCPPWRSATPGLDLSIYQRLPPLRNQSDYLLPVTYPGDRVAYNCVHDLLDRHIDSGHGDKIAIHTSVEQLDYLGLRSLTDQCAAWLADQGAGAGHRVMLLDTNTAALAIWWLAVQRIGAIAVTVMPLLKSDELLTLMQISEPSIVLCAGIASSAARKARSGHTRSGRALVFQEYRNLADVARLTDRARAPIHRYSTKYGDIALIGFTSGTTGKPKATVHYQRDIKFVCETVGRGFLGFRRDDVATGTSPLAFTFGLGGLLLFPLYAGAATILDGPMDTDTFVRTLRSKKPTVCLSVPTFYRRLLPLVTPQMTASLRHCVASGEALPESLRTEWLDRTGRGFTELLGSTEMLHAFAGSLPDSQITGSLGRALDNYQIAILDPDGRRCVPEQPGRLAVRGPTGCRYLSDDRQSEYVQQGWNITGDWCSMDTDGNLVFLGRYDELIISSGYNIAGLEVEDILLQHPMVDDCAVVGLPDPERGSIVAAFVVPTRWPDDTVSAGILLQRFVQRALAPYKYPRAINFVSSLPRNQSGKLQRYRLTEKY